MLDTLNSFGSTNAMSSNRSEPSLRILVLDDEPVSRKALVECLADTPHEVRPASDVHEALDLLDEELIDVAFVDLRLEGASGIEFIPKALERAPWIKVVLMTAYASIESAVEAVRAGAVDYLEKPFRPGQVKVLVEKLLAIRRRERESKSLSGNTDRAEPELESEDPEMQKVLELARQAADSDATILLLGESGTGKGVLARAIHGWSARHGAPFSVVSCPSLSEDLLRSELFGHVRGAFTGAIKAQRGRIATTEGGTLFLDEVADLPLSIQPQLLRFIQDREYERVGDTRTRRADVRLVTATNQDIQQDVWEGRFREDLFYRLNVIQMTIPPLRDRPSDIVPLAERFLHRYSASNNRLVEGFSEDARSLLRALPWPGNVRELQNAVERAVILAKGRLIGPELLPSSVPGNPPPSGIDGDGNRPLLSLEEMEKAHIRHVLEATSSVQEAASALEISTTTLWRRRKKHDI